MISHRQEARRRLPISSEPDFLSVYHLFGMERFRSAVLCQSYMGIFQSDTKMCNLARERTDQQAEMFDYEEEESLRYLRDTKPRRLHKQDEVLLWLLKYIFSSGTATEYFTYIQMPVFRVGHSRWAFERKGDTSISAYSKRFRVYRIAQAKTD